MPIITFLMKSVSWGNTEGPIILAGLEFPQRGINGDTMLTCSFQSIQDPSILEGTYSHLSSHLLKFFDTITFVIKQPVAVDLFSSENNVDINLFLYHSGMVLAVVFMTLVLWGQTHCKMGLFLWEDF